MEAVFISLYLSLYGGLKLLERHLSFRIRAAPRSMKQSPRFGILVWPQYPRSRLLIEKDNLDDRHKMYGMLLIRKHRLYHREVRLYHREVLGLNKPFNLRPRRCGVG